MFGLNVVVVVLLITAPGPAIDRTEKTTMSNDAHAEDQEAILQHIHGLFRAFLTKNREAVVGGHTKDWRGFQIRSDHIVRGIDEYMQAADPLLAGRMPDRYEILDTEFEFFDDRAIVFYTAQEWFDEPNGQSSTVILRSVDLYRREGGGWNQYGSNICVAPHAAAAQSDPWASPASGSPEQAATCPLTETDKKELLRVRSAVWQAWYANDRAGLEELLPPETLGIDPGVPEWADRAEALRRADEFNKNGGRLVRLDFPETRVQCFGDVAILYSRYEMQTETSEGPATLSGRGTEVFVRRNGRWYNVGWHLDSGK